MRKDEREWGAAGFFGRSANDWRPGVKPGLRREVLPLASFPAYVSKCAICLERHLRTR